MTRTYKKFVEKNIRTAWVKVWASEFLQNLENKITESEIEAYCRLMLGKFCEICHRKAEKRLTTENRKNENLDSWKQSSVSYLSGIRRAIRDWSATVDLTEANSYHQKTTEGILRQHLALLYINFPQSHNEANVLAKQTKKDNQRRNLENIQCLDDYQNTIERMLASDDHRVLAAGLVAATGRRPSEIYKTAKFQQVSQFEVLFSGQLKTRGEDREPYTTYTLIESAKVINGLARLRRMPEIKELCRRTLAEIDSGRNSRLNEQIERYFLPLVKPPHGERFLSAKNLRASYAAITIYLFCPHNFSTNLFIKERLGHTSDATATAYEDYQVTDLKGTPLIRGVWVQRLNEAQDKPMEALIMQHRIRMTAQARETLDDQSLLPFADQVSRVNELIRLAKVGKEFEDGKLVKEVVTVVEKVTPLATVASPIRGIEKVQQAVAAIKAYNERQASMKDMWMINTSTLKDLSNCRTSIVEGYLKSDEGQIEVVSYNEKHQMGYQHNRGRGKVTSVIVIG